MVFENKPPLPPLPSGFPPLPGGPPSLPNVPPPLQHITQSLTDYLRPKKKPMPAPAPDDDIDFHVPVGNQPEVSDIPVWFVPLVKGYVKDGGNTTMSEVATQALINKFPPGEHWFRSIQQLFLLEPDVAVRERIILTLMASHRLEFALMVHIYWSLMEEAIKHGADEPDTYDTAVSGVSFAFVASGIYSGLDSFTYSVNIMKKTFERFDDIESPDEKTIGQVLGVILS